MRSVAKTEANERSSRSHSVFQLTIEGKNKTTGSILQHRSEGILSDHRLLGLDVSCSSKVNLIDLAGSERLSSSKATGDRLGETKAINKSLSALGKVIMCLDKGVRLVVSHADWFIDVQESNRLAAF